MSPVTTYEYGSNAGPQRIELDPILGGTIMIGTEARAGRYTISGLYAQVVPIRASAWLMLSALGVLFGARKRATARR